MGGWRGGETNGRGGSGGMAGDVGRDVDPYGDRASFKYDDKYDGTYNDPFPQRGDECDEDAVFDDFGLDSYFFSSDADIDPSADPAAERR